MKKYYFANEEHMDEIYGGESAVCFDEAEVKRLAEEWGMTIDELMDQLHEATEEEIATYGVYNG